MLLGEHGRERLVQHGISFLLSPLLFIVIASCASQDQDELTACKETATQGRSVPEQLACIYVIVQNPDTLLAPELLTLSGKASTTYRAAVESLLASGYLVEIESLRPVGEGWPDGTPEILGYYPTAEGMEYLRQHKYPVRSWFERNWFALSIAVVNVTLAGLAIVVPLFWWKGRRNRG